MGDQERREGRVGKGKTDRKNREKEIVRKVYIEKNTGKKIEREKDSKRKSKRERERERERCSNVLNNQR